MTIVLQTISLLQTTETYTQTVVTDSYCYTTEKKLLGPKTKECSRRRAIDTSNIFGIGEFCTFMKICVM